MLPPTPDAAAPRGFSLVIPTYDEEESFPRLWERLARVLEDLDVERWEVIFVDDGSSDGTRRLIEELTEREPRVRGVFLTRNFGHQPAVSIGLEQARGAVVCVLDADLQDPPEVIPDLLRALAECDVAYAVRRRRKENVLKRATYDLFYRFLQAVSDIPIPRDAGDFCCMRRPVVDALLRLPERSRFVRGLRAWVGFRQRGVEYEREARTRGASKYSLRKLVALAYDGLFSFSSLPVKAIQILGFAVSTLALLVAFGYLIWYFLAPEQFPTGWATTIISLWFLGGVQMLFLGLLGEYVFRTFDEARARPTALVARIVGGDERG